MKRIIMAAALLATVCVAASAAKKDKEPKEIIFGVKSGIITMSNENMGNFGGNRGGMGGFGGGMGMGMQGGFGGGAAMGAQRGQGAQGGAQAGGQNAERAARAMNFDPSQIVTKIYFDDYGRKIATVTSRGEAGTTRSIVVDGETININEAENTATKMPSFGRRGGNGNAAGARGGMGGMMGGFGGGMGGQIKPALDFSNMDSKTIKKNKVKELGEEEVAGVSCKKYSFKTSNQGYVTEQTVWIYKNIVMKSETESDWGTMGQSVKTIEEADVPESMFTVPEGCEVQEMQMRGGMGGGMMMGGGFGGGMGGDFGGQGGFGGGMGGMQGGFGGGMGGF